MKKRTVEDYENLGRQAGFTWIGDALPGDMLERTKWKCKARGHTFWMRGANVYLAVSRPGSRGCPYCSHRWRRTGGDYHHLAKLHGIEWIGKVLPENTRHPTKWLLPNGEIREISYRVLASRVTQLSNPKLRVQDK